jgi:hypothetical protein
MCRAAFAFAAIGVLAIGPAFGACTKPAAPRCAIEGAFAKPWDQDQCRRQMIDYNRDMGAFAQCLKDDGQDEKSAREELATTLSEFNRRSRELPADDL